MDQKKVLYPTYYKFMSCSYCKSRFSFVHIINSDPIENSNSHL